MARMVIDIDETLLEDAMQALGTTTAEETVNGALRHIAGVRLRRARLEWWMEHAPPVEDVERDRRDGWDR